MSDHQGSNFSYDSQVPWRKDPQFIACKYLYEYNQTQNTKDAFQIFLQPDLQMSNDIFNRPSMTHTQILLQRGAQNKDFSTVSQMDSTRSLVPSVAQAMYMTVYFFTFGNVNV